MTETTSAEASQAKSVLTKIAAFVADRNIPFLVCSIGMIVMLLWRTTRTTGFRAYSTSMPSGHGFRRILTARQKRARSDNRNLASD